MWDSCKKVFVFIDPIFLSLFSYVLASANAEAVPKKILELMNVPGLTRENVASHLQVNFFFFSKISSRELLLVEGVET